jgi:multidrug efflux system membrane fusion protein
VAASQAAADQANLNLQYATIRAPISGRTGSLRVREGNLVRSSDTSPLVTINQIQPILVRFAVPASNLGAIQRYRSDRMTVFASPTGGGSESEGTLVFVDNAVDTTTGTILLKGRFPNASGALWPGEFVNVRLRLYVNQNALVVPSSAVVTGQQGSIVFVVQPDSSAATKKVTVERSAGSMTIVSGDIKPGDRVVTDGQLRLRQGAKVQIKSRGDSARTSQGAS